MIEYNYLGLADKIHFGSTKRIEFIYDAEGQKLAQKLINGSNTHLTEYIGDLIYVDGQLQTIFHDEGRVKVDGNNNRYQFFITDHLGNTRIIVERVNDTTALVQENHYGVWGEPLIGIGMDGDWNFLFQGKEYVDFEGLNLYDFHSRFYDPWTGRFWQIDGADQFASGYVGMGNNPLVYVDPDGQWIHLAVGALIGGFSGWQIGKAQGAKGWDMFGYIMGGATIGAVSGGFGEAVLGAFSTTATSGMNLGASILAYGTSGSLGGAIGGGGFAALAGNDVGKGMLYGAVFGFLGGTLTGIGQHLSHLNYIDNLPRIAQNDPPVGSISNPIALDEVVISSYKYGLNPAHSGAIEPNYILEDLLIGGVMVKGIGRLWKYGSGYMGGLWAGRMGKGLTHSVSRTESTLGHIFRDAPGHVNPRTISSQERYINLFERVANNPKNLNQNILSPSAVESGVQGFTKSFKNGQVWVQSRNGRIFNAGVNKVTR